VGEADIAVVERRSVGAVADADSAETMEIPWT
jgi:hypothetical protein